MKPTKPNTRREYDPAVSFRIPRDTAATISDLEAASGLGKSAILRLAVINGLPAVKKFTGNLKPAR